ncbi:MAG: hypothetical protein JXJ20_13145 [Anaerolineae bacterium]|nr:hypothetical protein [Anaerolineae bacterium]
MGIKLDWHVESEQTTQRATEDPETRRQRRRARRRLLLLVVALASVLALVAALVLWRLQTVEDRYRQDLLDTVEIEITALRLGDYEAFMAIQRSISAPFIAAQEGEFEEYQQLKQVHRVELTGRVLDDAIDDRTGRVVVEEIIDGVPYKVVWFYWYYEDAGELDQPGWRRVPDNLAFWGDAGEIESGPVRITYRALDQALAGALAPRLAEWWARGCTMLQCETPPPSLHVDIVAQRPTTIEWTGSSTWRLTVTSPLIGRARADLPLTPELEAAIADQVASRLVRYAAGDAAPLAYADAAWLHTDLSRWLRGTLLSGEDAPAATTGGGFIETLIAQYGSGAPHTALRSMRSDSTVGETLAAVTGVSFDLLSVDQLNSLGWRDFFQWRLDLEARLLIQPDSGGAFLALYDLENQDTANEAALRQEDPAYAARPAPQVQAISITRDDSGRTYAYADATWTAGDQVINDNIIWRLTGTTWKRVN